MFKITPKKILQVFSLTLLVLAVAFICFLQSNYIVPIIMYHSVKPVSDPNDRLCVPLGKFESQMRFLKHYRYNVITLEQLGGLIREGKKIPFRTVVITFDDGYMDNYTYAFPVLKKYGLPATVFLIVDEVERPLGDRLGWKQIQKMQDSGLVTFGSHTVTHPWLPEVKSEVALRYEIFNSKSILEEKLKRQVNCFSYPGGRFNEHIKDLVARAGYKLAVATSPGKRYSKNDLFLLKRTRISPKDGNLFFFLVKTSGYYGFAKEKGK